MAGTQESILVAGSYILILLLIIFFDLRERRISNFITFPALGLVLLVGITQGNPTFYLSIIGALCGFLFFYGLFLLGKWLYGPAALGFGDVKLALLLGAMVGLQYVFFTLALGMLLAGAAAFILLRKKERINLRSTIPYGAFMACAGIIMLVWANII